MSADAPQGATLSFLRGVSVYRWGTFVWMSVVAALHTDEMRSNRAWLAVVLLVAALGVTVVAGLLRTLRSIAASPPVLAAEIAVGAALIAATGWVYGIDHVNGRGPSLGTGWPTTGILAVGVARGPRWGAAAGAAIGLSRGLGGLAAGVGEFDRALVVSVLSYTVISMLNGVVAGLVMDFVRNREHEVALARARDEVARTLHDGVLQTLAAVQQRAVDPALARLARQQEHDLRDFLYGPPPGTDARHHNLERELRSAARRFERVHVGKVEVIVAPDVPTLAAATVDAVAGAVAEALANAGRHGRAERITVYAEPTDDWALFCSVHDHGTGFDTSRVAEGRGITSSIRGRIAEVGGRVEIRSRVGSGTEVLMWVP